MVQSAIWARGHSISSENGKKQDGGGYSLIFARTDTAAWQDWVFPFAYGAMFIRGRIRFYRADGTPGETAPAPSAIVAYTKEDFARLCGSGIKGFAVRFTGRQGREKGETEHHVQEDM